MTWTTITLDIDARGVARLVLDRPEKHNVALRGDVRRDRRGGGADRGRLRRPGRGADRRGAELLRRGRSRLDAGAVRGEPRRADRRGAAARDDAAGAEHPRQAGDRAGERRGLRRRRRADGGLRRGGRRERRPLRADRDAARADPGDDLALRARADRRGAGARRCSSRRGSSMPPRRRRSGSSPAWCRPRRSTRRSRRRSRPIFATAPAAVAAAKRLARSLGPRIDAEVIEATIARLADTWETPEAQRGDRRLPREAAGGLAVLSRDAARRGAPASGSREGSRSAGAWRSAALAASLRRKRACAR